MTVEIKLTSFIVYGSWKIRHNEPLGKGEDSLSLHPLPQTVSGREHSLLLDLHQKIPAVAAYEQGNLHWEPTSDADTATGNLNAGPIPLAVISIHDDQARITHLLTRLERHVTHLIKPPVESPTFAPADLLATLVLMFQRNHIQMNNFECYYIKGMTDIELEQKFEIDGSFDYHVMNRKWYENLDNGLIPGFALQLGDELEHWAYDNDFAKILPNKEGAAGYLSIMHWSRKRKTSWDEPVVTFKKKLYAEDALERWERNYPNQRIEGTPEHALADYFDLPIKTLPSWRRTRYDIACESVNTGNIFMVNFEDSRVYDDRSAGGRLQQCEIEYLKTRGEPSHEAIYADFALLSDHVETFIAGENLKCNRTNYSKLTFLEDYVKAR